MGPAKPSSRLGYHVRLELKTPCTCRDSHMRWVSAGEWQHSLDRENAGCGAAWLARLTGGQEVPGSNPGSPTTEGHIRAVNTTRGGLGDPDSIPTGDNSLSPSRDSTVLEVTLNQPGFVGNLASDDFL